MPLLYGEGKRACYRLQLEILRQTQDYTLFAWAPLGERTQHLTGGPGGIFSSSPQQFDPRIAKTRQSSLGGPAHESKHEMTNVGLRISLPCIPTDHGRNIAVLNLHDAQGMFTGIILEKLATECYGRVKGSTLAHVSWEEIETDMPPAMFILAEDGYDESAQAGTFKFQVDRLDIHRCFKSCTVKTPRRTTNPGKLSLLARESISLGSLEQAVIILYQGAMSFSIVFGINVGQLWLWVIKTHSQDERSGVLQLAEKEMRGAAGWEYNRDFAQVQLSTNKSWVQILARKRPDGTQALWKLTVAISESQMSASQLRKSSL
jgi:hypothetical protein